MDDPWTDPEYVRTRTRRKTIWLFGALAHLALFGTLVVWPYFRGDIRGGEARLAFGRFAACFYGGETTGATGLALPRGDRLAYASHYLGDEPTWPSRCVPLLDEILVGHPLLLYPGVKGAEEGVHRAVTALVAELDVLDGARGAGPSPGPIPTSAHEAVNDLAAALASMAREVDPMTPIQDNAIRLGPIALPDPARVPLTAARDAVIRVEARADGILVRSIDARGLSRTRVGGGRSRYLRIRRPSAVRGMIASAGSEEPLLVFATASSRCEADPAHCVQRSTGVAEWVAGEGLAPARWLSGHPFGRVDRVVSSRRGYTVIIAVADGGAGGEVRRFSARESSVEEPLAEPEGERGGPTPEARVTPAEPPAIHPASHVTVLEGMSRDDDALLLGDAVLYSVKDEGGVRFFVRSVTGGEPLALAHLEGEAPFIAACTRGAGARHVAVGTDRGVEVLGVDVESRAVTPRFRGPALGAPAVDARYPSRDRIRVSCDESGASVAMHHVGGELTVVTCVADADCVTQEHLDHVSAFGLVRMDEHTLTAWTGDDPEGAITVRTDGPLPMAARIVGACFSDGEGLCGVPRLAARNGRVILVAQEGSDLRVVESIDAGRTFESMRGIR